MPKFLKPNFSYKWIAGSFLVFTSKVNDFKLRSEQISIKDSKSSPPRPWPRRVFLTTILLRVASSRQMEIPAKPTTSSLSFAIIYIVFSFSSSCFRTL